MGRFVTFVAGLAVGFAWALLTEPTPESVSRAEWTRRRERERMAEEGRSLREVG